METKLINFRVPIAKARKLQAYAAIKNRTVTSVLTQFIDNLTLSESELKEILDLRGFELHRMSKKIEELAEKLEGEE